MQKILIAVVLLPLLLTACPTEQTMLRGTVRHISVEGGFYGIVGDDGKRFDPVNLPAPFQKDNLPVRFRGKVLKDRVSFHMWGELFEIESIVRDDSPERGSE